MANTFVRLISAPGESYLDEIHATLATAQNFTLVTAFASAAGLELLKPTLVEAFARGAQGRIIVAVDRRGFNAAPVFEALLDLKEAYRARLSLGLVLEQVGLLHAKALFTEGPTGPRLIVGSANLTRSALEANHELGVLISSPPSEMCTAFRRFVEDIAPRSLDGDDARALLQGVGLLAPRARPPGAAYPAGPPPQPLGSLFAQLPAQPPVPMGDDDFINEWIGNGAIVGRGRRSLGSLVLRVPQEVLTKQGVLRAPRRAAIGASSYETRTMGYGVDLLPSVEAEATRRQAKRVSLLLSKLTLNLPCFGRWMPNAYWESFLHAKDALLSTGALEPVHLREAANAQRTYLQGGGLKEEVDRIVDRLVKLDILARGKEDDFRKYVLPRFGHELDLRTPELLANCVDFRTARQQWAPSERTETPFRQLLADVIQATFSASYNSGDWPRRFRSFAARTIAEAIEANAKLVGRVADEVLANDLLNQVATWELEDRPLKDVVSEFRALLGTRAEFEAPPLELLTRMPTGGDDDGDDGGSEADDI